MAIFFNERYSANYGPFQYGGNVGNDIFSGRFGTKWSYIHKGGEHKQYSAQISFVINAHDGCLDVGFYFGSASARGISAERRIELTTQLNNLGLQLQTSISNIPELNVNFQKLFEDGFKAIYSNQVVSPEEWVNQIGLNPAGARIITKLFPNEFGAIEISTIDLAVSKVITLMAGLNQELTVINTIPRPPKTPAQRAEEAARKMEIGIKGEEYILENEINKLQGFRNRKQNYPIHQAKISDDFGYDILSHDENENDIFIEVKTTTLSRQNPISRQFYISNNERTFYNNNVEKYKLVRVYEIEGNPSSEEVNMSEVTFDSLSYKVSY
ncbi:MAG TPA: DUF3883 domain-containing protein [Brumimicrobium sp.]|nr:DUF3883 domain-containing protein [Brumimicrobium sp.]